MTTSEMYQEIVDQEMADIFLDEDGYIIDDYSLDNVVQEEYDIQYIIFYPLSIPYHTLIMTHSVMLTLLNRASNGNEMLALIDSFSDTQPETVEYTNQPTLEHIEF